MSSKGFRVIFSACKILLLVLINSNVSGANFMPKSYGDKKYIFNCDQGVVKEGKTSVKNRYRVGLIFASSITSNTPTTGFLYKVFSLTKAMVDKGHSYVFFICNSNFKTREKIDSLKLKGVKIYILDKDLFYNKEHMSKLMRDEKLDVLQYEDPQTYLSLGVPLKTCTNLPSILVCHDIEDDLMNALKRYKNVYLLDYTHYVATHFADAVMTLTLIDKEKRIKRHGIPKDKVFVTPIGVDDNLSFRGPNLNKKIIGFVGNQFYEPNRRAVRYLIDKIFPLVKVKHPDAIIKIIGKTPEELSSFYKDREDVIFAGEIKDQDQYVNEMATFTIGTCCIDVGCGMNVKVSNYCALGIPVVLTPIGKKGYESITSLQVVPLDSVKISNKISELLSDMKYAAKIGKESHDMIFKNLSYKTIIHSLEEALHYAYQHKVDSLSKVIRPLPIWMEEGRHEDDILKGQYIIEAAG